MSFATFGESFGSIGAVDSPPLWYIYTFDPPEELPLIGFKQRFPNNYYYKRVSKRFKEVSYYKKDAFNSYLELI